MLKEEEMNKDPVLSEEDKNHVKNEHNKKKFILQILGLIIIVLGALFYYNRKTIQHAGNFSYESFFIQ